MADGCSSGESENVIFIGLYTRTFQMHCNEEPVLFHIQVFLAQSESNLRVFSFSAKSSGEKYYRMSHHSKVLVEQVDIIKF